MDAAKGPSHPAGVHGLVVGVLASISVLSGVGERFRPEHLTGIVLFQFLELSDPDQKLPSNALGDLSRLSVVLDHSFGGARDIDPEEGPCPSAALSAHRCRIEQHDPGGVRHNSAIMHGVPSDPLGRYPTDAHLTAHIYPTIWSVAFRLEFPHHSGHGDRRYRFLASKNRSGAYRSKGCTGP